jgi:hypothetical protein
VAANEDDAAEPVSAKGTAAPKAGVVGLDAVATETVTLLLEVLGWSVTTANALHDLPARHFKLVFIDERLFMANPPGSETKFGTWENTVLVGPPSPTAFIGTKDAKIFRAYLPLDISHIETIIETAS